MAANGSLMRIHPLGAKCVFKTLDETFQITTANSTTTHADPRCVFACLIQVGLNRGLLRGEVTEQKDIEDMFKHADAWYAGWCAEQAAAGRDEYFDSYAFFCILFFKSQPLTTPIDTKRLSKKLRLLWCPVKTSRSRP